MVVVTWISSNSRMVIVTRIGPNAPNSKGYFWICVLDRELYCMMGIKEEKYALLSTDVESVALYSACIGNGMVVKPPCGYQSRECTNVHRRRQPRGYVIKAKNLMDHNRTKPVDIKFHYKWAPRSQT